MPILREIHFHVQSARLRNKLSYTQKVVLIACSLLILFVILMIFILGDSSYRNEYISINKARKLIQDNSTTTHSFLNSNTNNNGDGDFINDDYDNDDDDYDHKNNKDDVKNDGGHKDVLKYLSQPCFTKENISITSKVKECTQNDNFACYSETAQLLMSSDVDDICKIKAQYYFTKTIKVNETKIIFWPESNITKQDEIMESQAQMFESSQNRNACVVETSETFAEQASAIVFEVNNSTNILKKMEVWKKWNSNNNQKWILSILEPISKYDTAIIKTLNDFRFDWTATYKTSSQIPRLEIIPVSRIMNHNESELNHTSQISKNFKIAVCKNTKLEKVRELILLFKQNGVNVNTNFKCRELFNESSTITKDYIFIIHSQKVYCPGYVDPLYHIIIKHKKIPIVIDGDEEVYKKISPPDSFYYLKELNFKNVQNFIKNVDKYINASWRINKRQILGKVWFLRRLCALLHANPNNVDKTDLNDWYNKDSNQCW